MSKYFTPERVKEACQHLGNFHSGKVLVPLVLAVNGVNHHSNVVLKDHAGTDSGFLKNHFHGHLIGLSQAGERNNIRPSFNDVSLEVGDFISIGRQQLWANLYSQTGYNALKNKGVLSVTNGGIRLQPTFRNEFETNLASSFYFEEMLVWLYAFIGFPETINSWDELFIYFQESYLGSGCRIAPEFSSRFNANNGVPWPTDLLNDRPSNEAFIEILITSRSQTYFDYSTFVMEFLEKLNDSGVRVSHDLVNRFITSLLTKRFLIFTGLAGSGKTKLAQSFAKWISSHENQYAIISVGPDWTSNENVLGYADALDINRYVTPKILQLIIEANEPANTNKPFFIILDEMNLSHVERYFADILSALESDEDVHLHSDSGASARSGVPKSVKIPSNLFIIGTVNVDETTYMFSPKVLDRANVIEFRVTRQELGEYLDNPSNINLSLISSKGQRFGPAFVATAKQEQFTLEVQDKKVIKEELLILFDVLSKFGVEFGFRTAKEIARYLYFYKKVSSNGYITRDAIDMQILQKLLPKLHGPRKKMERLLWVLASICNIEHKWEGDSSAGNMSNDRGVEPEATAPLVSATEESSIVETPEEGGRTTSSEDLSNIRESTEGDIAIPLIEEQLINRDEIFEKITKAMQLHSSSNPLSERDGELINKWENAYYKRSYEKIQRMLILLEQNGFVSFSEA
ncbi:McrB family protein [Paenibacillus sp. Root444D2]|uniref:McrB family protein n=1 Tax=Paenibacillus sp. Root444D2 TaxID=1736538 RepID=UPI00070FDDFF|nr:hypothetical protein [Paenibacillus sp. Root444D2]KQX68469.1 hypothetical protein ASD40_23560 [Paenibacillus sp. Root444D2]